MREEVGEIRKIALAKYNNNLAKYIKKHMFDIFMFDEPPVLTKVHDAK